MELWIIGIVGIFFSIIVYLVVKGGIDKDD